MNNMANILQMLPQFKANPMQTLMSMKMNVPQSMMNDPNAIVNHLLQTGQISQDAVNRAYQMMGQFRR